MLSGQTFELTYKIHTGNCVSKLTGITWAAKQGAWLSVWNNINVKYFVCFLSFFIDRTTTNKFYTSTLYINHTIHIYKDRNLRTTHKKCL